jgi:acetoin utilization protein AcuB
MIIVIMKSFFLFIINNVNKENVMNVNDLTVQEFTSPSPITIHPDESLDSALELMQKHGIRHLPVMDGGEVIGVVSERDLLSNMGKDWTKMMKILDVMNSSILSANENDSLGEVAYQLSSQKKGSAIILDNSGQLAGIFTTTDALNALVEIFFP